MVANPPKQIKPEGVQWQRKESLRLKRSREHRISGLQVCMIALTVEKGRKDVIKAFADAQGESVNGFINRAVNAAMSGEQAAGDHAPAPLVTPERFVKISEHIKRTGETPEEFVDRAIEDTIARDAVSLSMGINPAGK